MPGNDRSNGLWVALGFAWRLGYSIAVPLVVLLFFGRWLDKRLGTSPWFLLIGLGLSFATTNVMMFHEAFRVMREANRDNEVKLSISKDKQNSNTDVGKS